nr:ABC transporter permease [Olsenella sp. oral taxon 809]
MVCIAVLMSSVGRRPVRNRRLASPEPAHARNLALLGACVTIALIAWAWNFELEVAVLGRSALASSPVQLALVGAALLVYALVSASVGFLAGQLGVSENAANALANILSMVMSFLGGAWTGLSLLPDALLAVAHFTPAYWVTLVVEGAAGLGEVTAEAVLPLVGDLGVCALFGVAAVLVGLVLGRSRSRAQVA